MADTNEQIVTLKKRIEIFLEDKDWESAKEYCNRVLDIDPENQSAYLLLTLAENEASDLNSLVNKGIDIRNTKHYKRIINGENKEVESEVNTLVRLYKEKVTKEKYDNAVAFQRDNTEYSLKKAIALFSEISGYKDADVLKKQCENALPLATDKKKKQTKIGTICIIIALLVVAALAIIHTNNVRKEQETIQTYMQTLNDSPMYRYDDGNNSINFDFRYDGTYYCITDSYSIGEKYAFLSFSNTYNSYNGDGYYEIKKDKSGYYIDTGIEEFTHMYLPTDPTIQPINLMDERTHLFE